MRLVDGSKTLSTYVALPLRNLTLTNHDLYLQCEYFHYAYFMHGAIMYPELTEWLQAAERSCGAILERPVERAMQEDLLRVLDGPIPHKGMGGAFLDCLLSEVQSHASIVSGSLISQTKASEDAVHNAVRSLLVKLSVLREELEARIRERQHSLS